jgi:hypothetical protein
VTSPEEMVPDDEAIAYEVASVKAVTGGLSAALAPVIAQALAAYAGGVAGSSLAGLLLGALGRVRWSPMNSRLGTVATDAVDLGADRALRGRTARERRRARGPMSGPEVPDLDGATRVRLDSAMDLVRELPLETKRDLSAVVGRMSQVRSRAEGQVRWTANEGLNLGVVQVARRLGKSVIWVAERNACLHCLAYAGWSVRPGDTFPASLTYGDEPLRQDGVPHPPLHPGCRCQLRLYDGDPGVPSASRSALDPAARIAAEARRSVIYGWTDYASEAATLRAMDRLLRRGAGLPPSVERRARELLRRGQTQDRPKA